MRLAIFMVFVGIAAAAGDNATIAGSVTDPLGDGVENAQIVAKNASTGKSRSGSAAAHGRYSILNLEPGTYDVSVNVGGLKPYSRKGIMVEAGKTTALDIRLEDTTQLSTLGEDRTAVETQLKRHHPPAGPTPRTASGKPDFSGVWWRPVTTDPGKPEFLPWAAKVAKERTDNLRKDSPQSRCLPAAVVRLGPLFEFVQSPQMMIEISDDDSPGFHQIYLDGRPHPKDPNPAWYGHNVGHWEGDTLVIDRVGFNDQVWLDEDLHPHSDKLHVTERYRRPDLGHLEIDITVEDPGALAKPWTLKKAAELAPNEEIYEFICPENNRDVEHLVGK